MGANSKTYWIKANGIKNDGINNDGIKNLDVSGMNYESEGSDEMNSKLPCFENREVLLHSIVEREFAGKGYILKDGHDDGDVVFILNRDNLIELHAACRKLIDKCLDARIQKDFKKSIADYLRWNEYDEYLALDAVELHADIIYSLELLEQYPDYYILCEISY